MKWFKRLFWSNWVCNLFQWMLLLAFHTIMYRCQDFMLSSCYSNTVKYYYSNYWMLNHIFPSALSDDYNSNSTLSLMNHLKYQWLFSFCRRSQNICGSPSSRGCLCCQRQRGRSSHTKFGPWWKYIRRKTFGSRGNFSL